MGQGAAATRVFSPSQHLYNQHTGGCSQLLYRRAGQSYVDRWPKATALQWTPSQATAVQYSSQQHYCSGTCKELPVSIWSVPNSLSIGRAASGPLIAVLICQDLWGLAATATAISGVRCCAQLISKVSTASSLPGPGLRHCAACFTGDGLVGRISCPPAKTAICPWLLSGPPR